MSVEWRKYDAKATGEDTMEVDSLMIVNQLNDPTFFWFSWPQNRQRSSKSFTVLTEQISVTTIQPNVLIIRCHCSDSEIETKRSGQLVFDT